MHVHTRHAHTDCTRTHTYTNTTANRYTHTYTNTTANRYTRMHARTADVLARSHAHALLYTCAFTWTNTYVCIHSCTLIMRMHRHAPSPPPYLTTMRTDGCALVEGYDDGWNCHTSRCADSPHRSVDGEAFSTNLLAEPLLPECGQKKFANLGDWVALVQWRHSGAKASSVGCVG